MKDIILGKVTRYEVPNIKALNFVCNNSLMGGGNDITSNGYAWEEFE